MLSRVQDLKTKRNFWLCAFGVLGVYLSRRMFLYYQSNQERIEKFIKELMEKQKKSKQGKKPGGKKYKFSTIEEER